MPPPAARSILWTLCWSLSSSLVKAACNAGACEIQLGVYGPITSKSTTFLASAVSFDIDFRKNHDPALVTRFGPPIVSVPNLNPNLRIKVTIGNSNSETDVGVGTALDMFLGRDGMSVIAGLVGGYHSAISMPVAALAANLQVPQISWGSTSPKLSNKGQYPYFSRTIPPDSIQGSGMWKFITHFQIPSVAFCYASEPYGEGLFQTVANLASTANEAFRIVGVAVAYMPSNYDIAEAYKSVDVAKASGTKFIYLAMTSDQATPFGYALEERGCFGSDWQLVGSEAVKISATTYKPALGRFPNGFIRFNPIAKGPKFPTYEALWKNMTANDVTGTAATASYSLNKWSVKVADGQAAAPTDAMFANLDAYQLEDPFLFDACYCFVMAFNEMVNDGVDPANVKGSALLDKIKTLNFEGISGTVAFNTDGDRLASYTIDNIQPNSIVNTSRRLQASATTLVTVAIFSAATSQITYQAGKTLLWMSGSVQWSIPNTLVACLPGYEEEAVTRLCRACSSGWSSPGGAGVSCTRCDVGKAANSATAATSCVSCGKGAFTSEGGTTQCVSCVPGSYSDSVGASSCLGCSAGSFQIAMGQSGCMVCKAGNFSAASGSSLCLQCDLGYFSDADNTTKCTPCAQGFYQDAEGMTACKQCPSLQNTLLLGSTGISECRCEEGYFRKDASSSCKPCGEGLTCPYGSQMSSYWDWQNAGRPAPRPASQTFPLLKSRHAAVDVDPETVYSCRDTTRCPGGPPGTCGPNLRVDMISCARCADEWYWDGKECTKCSAVELSSVLFPIIPLIIAPIILSCMYYFFRDDVSKWGSWQNGCAALVFILLNHFQITVLASTSNIQYPTSVNGYFNVWAFSDDFLSVFKPQCAGLSDFQKAIAIRTLSPIFGAVLCIVTFAGSHLARAITGLAIAMDMNRMMNIFFSIMLTFFAGIVSMCFTIFKCHDNPNGKRTLNKDESIICGEETWNSMLVFAIFSIIFYIVGFGVLMIRTIIVAPANFNDVVFQRRWKFLFIKYRPDVWWWTIAFCLKGLTMNVGYVFLETGIAQINWIMSITGAYAGAGIYFMPWRHRAANLTEIYVHIMLLFVLSWLTWFAHDAIGVDAGKISDDLSVVLIIANVSTIVVGIGAGGYYAYSHNADIPKKVMKENMRKAHQAFSELGSIAFPDFQNLLTTATEWDRNDLIKAATIVRVEFMGSNDSYRASPTPTKKLSDLTMIKKEESIPIVQAEPEGEPEKKQQVMSQNLPPPRSPRQEIVKQFDEAEIPAESHYTPRGINNRCAATPRTDISPRSMVTPRSDFHGTPPGTPRQTPRQTPRESPRASPRNR